MVLAGAGIRLAGALESLALNSHWHGGKRLSLLVFGGRARPPAERHPCTGRRPPPQLIYSSIPVPAQVRSPERYAFTDRGAATRIPPTHRAAPGPGGVMSAWGTVLLRLTGWRRPVQLWPDRCEQCGRAVLIGQTVCETCAHRDPGRAVSLRRRPR